MVFLSDSKSYNNDDSQMIGWGFKNWKKILKEALRRANAIEAGF